MIKQNTKIITAHLNNKEQEKLDDLKELLNTYTFPKITQF